MFLYCQIRPQGQNNRDFLKFPGASPPLAGHQVQINLVLQVPWVSVVWGHAAERRRRRFFCHAAADFGIKRRRASLISPIMDIFNFELEEKVNNQYSAEFHGDSDSNSLKGWKRA